MPQFQHLVLLGCESHMGIGTQVFYSHTEYSFHVILCLTQQLKHLGRKAEHVVQQPPRLQNLLPPILGAFSRNVDLLPVQEALLKASL